MKKERACELYRIVDDMITDLSRNPHLYTPNPEETWSALFGWCEGAFQHEGTCGCGDPPMPVRDGGLDGGWTSYDYDTTMSRGRCPFPQRDLLQRRRRVLRRGLQPVRNRRERRGTERLCFISGQEGDWDVDAYHERSYVPEVTEWDVLAFQYDMANSGCYYYLLHQALYSLDCVITGKDPLGSVYPESKVVEGDVRVTMRSNGECEGRVLWAGSQESRLRLLQEATGFIGGRAHARSFEDLKEACRKMPEGTPRRQDRVDNLLPGSFTFGWAPEHVGNDCIRIMVSAVGKMSMPNKAGRIREIMSRDLEKDILGYQVSLAVKKE